MPLEYITNEIEEAKRFKRMQAELQEVRHWAKFITEKFFVHYKKIFGIVSHVKALLATIYDVIR